MEVISNSGGGNKEPSAPMQNSRKAINHKGMIVAY